jgi:hypothetical protein
MNAHCLWLSACAAVRTGRNGVVSIATRHRLEEPGIESRWYAATLQTGPATHAASYTMDFGALPGAKPPGRGVEHLPPCKAEVKERVELYTYSSGPTRNFLGWTLLLPFSYVRSELRTTEFVK